MNKLTIRRANLNDITKYYEWINDPNVREYSYNSLPVTWEQHEKWFKNKIVDPSFTFFILNNLDNQSVGQVRFEYLHENNFLISISVASEFRGKGYGTKILKQSCDYFTSEYEFVTIHAYIKVENINSKVIFEKAGFSFKEQLIYKNNNSFHFILCK